jgi:hypothetical protein
MGIDEPPPDDRQPLLDKIHHALKERAILKGDTRYVQALHVCQRAMEANVSRPMRRLLKQHHP